MHFSSFFGPSFSCAEAVLPTFGETLIFLIFSNPAAPIAPRALRASEFPQHGPGFQRADDPDVVDSYMDDPAAASDSNSESMGDR